MLTKHSLTNFICLVLIQSILISQFQWVYAGEQEQVRVEVRTKNSEDTVDTQPGLICGFCRDPLENADTVQCSESAHALVHLKCAQNGVHSPRCATMGCEKPLLFFIPPKEAFKDDDAAMDFALTAGKRLQVLEDKFKSVTETVEKLGDNAIEIEAFTNNQQKIIAAEALQIIEWFKAQPVDYGYTSKWFAERTIELTINKINSLEKNARQEKAGFRIGTIVYLSVIGIIITGVSTYKQLDLEGILAVSGLYSFLLTLPYFLWNVALLQQYVNTKADLKDSLKFQTQFQTREILTDLKLSPAFAKIFATEKIKEIEVPFYLDSLEKQLKDCNTALELKLKKSKPDLKTE